MTYDLARCHLVFSILLKEIFIFHSKSNLVSGWLSKSLAAVMRMRYWLVSCLQHTVGYVIQPAISSSKKIIVVVEGQG